MLVTCEDIQSHLSKIKLSQADEVDDMELYTKLLNRIQYDIYYINY